MKTDYREVYTCRYTGGVCTSFSFWLRVLD